MPLDDARSSWRSGDDAFEDAMSDRELLGLVKQKSQAFDDAIRKRDRRETIAGTVVGLFFLPFVFIMDPSWLTQVGVALVLAGIALTIWMPRRARRRSTDASLGLPLADVLRSERAKLDAQIRLLRNVLWWYIGPLAIGIVLVVLGTGGLSWYTLGYAVLMAVVSAVVYRLNQQAVRRRLLPRRRELTRLLHEMEE